MVCRVGKRRLVTLSQGAGGLRSLLFGNGENGFLFDGMGNRSLWQDTAATTPVASDADPVARANDVSGRGNNATTATSTQRPLWRQNSGKSYIQPDGTDDRLLTPFLPTAALTVAAAWRCTDSSVTRHALGGGIGGGVGLVQIGTVGGTGKPNIYFASSNLNTTSYSSWIGQDHTVVVSGNNITWKVWIDGVLAQSEATTGSVSGTRGIALCCVQENSFVGTFLSGRLYAALALDRVVNDSEAARISSQFIRTYQ